VNKGPLYREKREQGALACPRIHIQRLGRCAGVVTPASHTMTEAVAIMTGATLAETPGRPAASAPTARAAAGS
jgi:hypothetical protein